MANRNKTVIMIPSWIHDTLKRNNLPLSTCLDYTKIKPLFSSNDLVIFLALQNTKYFSIILGLDNISSDLFWSWVKSFSDTNNTEINNINLLSSDESVNDELKNRLFNEANNDDSNKDSYVVYDITPEICGIVIYPGKFSSNNIEMQRELIEEIIEVFYRYLSFHEVAKTPFFRRYLEVLSKS